MHQRAMTTPKKWGPHFSEKQYRPTGDQTYENTLYTHLYNVVPQAHELFAYKNQIQRFILADTECSRLLTLIESLDEQPLAILKIVFLSLAYEDKTNSTYLIIRMFTIGANIVNKHLRNRPVLPRADLGLIENLLYMLGEDYTNPSHIKKITRTMNIWLRMGMQQSSALDSLDRMGLSSDKQRAVTYMLFLLATLSGNVLAAAN